MKFYKLVEGCEGGEGVVHYTIEGARRTSTLVAALLTLYIIPLLLDRLTPRLYLFTAFMCTSDEAKQTSLTKQVYYASNCCFGGFLLSSLYLLRYKKVL